jgi:tetratricopeptide (TPR) repeat protein
MKIILLLLLLISSVSALGLSLDKRRSQIISIIDEELDEVRRLASQTGNRNPDHLLRMAELNLEKARLWREKENQDYIALPNEVRRKTNKKRYFEKSASYFQRANSLCLKIAKTFKRYKSIGDVYYILGYNAKEAGQDKTALKYFSRAQSNTSKNSLTRIKSQISLAELYYNQKKYGKAIPLYEKSLSSYQDKWWTKDSFNLAWCYFRTNNYSRAINKMKEVFTKSTNPKFVDMRTSVERDIGLFFATAGKIEQGIDFYKDIGINFTDQLLRIAVTMKSKGQYDLANKTLKYALKYEKNQTRKQEVFIELLDLYSSFRKRKSHLNVSKILFSEFKKNNLSENRIKTLSFHVGKQGAILQKQVIGKTYKRLKKQRLSKANMAIDYFGMLAELNPEKGPENLFLQAETAFAIRSYQRSLIYYDKAFDLAVKQNDGKFKQRSMEGILSSLGKKRLSQNVKNSYYVPVYNKYLENYPKGKRSKSIYQKLFKVYLDKGDYKNAKATLDRFKTVYKGDWKIQEVMIAELMEINRKKKENDKIRLWIKDIDDKKYFVSRKYAKKLKELLTSIQIDDVQMDLKKGNKSKALIGYHNILKDANSTSRSKINAKYNLAALYYEMGSINNSYKWSNESLNEMGSKEAIKFSDSFLTISTFLFTQLEFEKSAELAQKVTLKLCKEKTRKKHIAFKNAAFMYLAEGQSNKVENLLNATSSCKIRTSIISSVRFELLKDYEKASNWRQYEYHYGRLARYRSNWPGLIIPSSKLALMHSNLGNQNSARKYERNKDRYYSYAVKNKKEIPVKALDQIADENIKTLESIKSQLLAVPLNFPAPTFQNGVKQKFAILDKLVSQSSKVQEIGSGNGIVKAYKVLIESHYAFAKQVQDFEPTGMKAEFVPLFKKDMNAQIVGPLLSQAGNYEKDAKKTISQNEILSVHNSSIEAQGQELPIRFWYTPKAVLMDRGGR